MTDPTYDNSNSTASTTASNTGGASPEYRDNLTVQDTTRSAAAPVASGGTIYGDSADTSAALGDTDETGSLISADKVQGTAVYDSAGERLGTIDSLMIDKRAGHVEYAVMASGGFLGIGERFQPLPWDVLSYDTDLGGYRVDRSVEAMKSAPNYSRDEVDAYDYGSRGRDIDDWYDSSANASTQSSTMPSSGLGSGSAIGAGNSGSGGQMGGTGVTGGVGSTGGPI